MKSFTQKVIGIVSQIPAGQVLTYSKVAELAGCAGAARAVGNILKRHYQNPQTFPCHRVVRSDGRVGGYAKGTLEKIRLLKSEGINVSKSEEIA